MFDIGFSELMVIGVVALVVIGPERLPKVARTAGHLYGRLQRYVSTVKSDISREVELDELKRAGQEFKDSVESATGSIQQQSTIVDDFLKNELAEVDRVVADMDANPPSPEPAPQQSLALDDPAQPQDEPAQPQDASSGATDHTAPPRALIEIASPRAALRPAVVGAAAPVDAVRGLAGDA